MINPQTIARRINTNTGIEKSKSGVVKIKNKMMRSTDKRKVSKNEIPLRVRLLNKIYRLNL